MSNAPPMPQQLSDGEASRLLQQTGLLFEINRHILHPHGLAFVVVDGADCKSQRIELRYTPDPEGFGFGSKDLEEGTQRYMDFLDGEQGRLGERLKAWGFVEQTAPLLEEDSAA